MKDRIVAAQAGAEPHKPQESQNSQRDLRHAPANSQVSGVIEYVWNVALDGQAVELRDLGAAVGVRQVMCATPTARAPVRSPG
jgi:hypothetical protein